MLRFKTRCLKCGTFAKHVNSRLAKCSKGHYTKIDLSGSKQFRELYYTCIGLMCLESGENYFPKLFLPKRSKALILKKSVKGYFYHKRSLFFKIRRWRLMDAHEST